MSEPVTFLDGRVTLYLGDCRELLPTMPVNAALVTDPQYGAGRFVSTHNSSRRGAGLALIRKDGNHDPSAGDECEFDPTPFLSFEHAVIWGANHFCSRLPAGNRWLVWDKLADKTPVPGVSDIELAWTSVRGPSRSFTHLWRGIMRAGAENVVNGGKLHPHQKPVALMEWSIEQLPDAETILDPFTGSGTTGVAAIKLGRRFIGIELDPHYFGIACKRIGEATKQPDLFIETAPEPKQEAML